ncbi:MAG: response regulator [Pseudomonadota bacterium]
MAERILIVEDEEKIAFVLRDYLRAAGYETDVLHEGTNVVRLVRDTPPDLLMLDLMLPGMDGITICKEVRQFSDLPIVMVTAKVDEIDRLIGLELGADDYICKPFNGREVAVRVRNILRRANSAHSSENDFELKYRGVTLDTEMLTCTANGELMELTPVEFRLLKTMMRKPGRPFSRDALMRASYPDNRIVSNRTVDSHIKNLRKKLTDAMDGETLIHAIYSVGYKME